MHVGKKFLNVFFSCTLAAGMMPTAALAETATESGTSQSEGSNTSAAQSSTTSGAAYSAWDTDASAVHSATVTPVTTLEAGKTYIFTDSTDKYVLNSSDAVGNLTAKRDAASIAISDGVATVSDLLDFNSVTWKYTEDKTLLNEQTNEYLAMSGSSLYVRDSDSLGSMDYTWNYVKNDTGYKLTSVNQSSYSLFLTSSGSVYYFTTSAYSSTDMNAYEVTFCSHENHGDEVVVAPTCTTDGYTSYHCSDCNQDVVTATTPSLGHSWSDYAVTKEATCTEDGSKTRSCTRENCSEVETEIIAATGHTLVYASEDSDNTYYKCSVCNETVSIAKDARVKTFDLIGVTATAEDNAYPWMVNANSDSTSTAEPVGGIKSGNKGVNSTNSITTFTFTSAKEFTLDFKYTANSESNYDFLTVYIDDTQIGTTQVFSKNGVLLDPVQVIKVLDAGSHTLKLDFKKDGSTAQGQDSGYVYDLSAKIVCAHDNKTFVNTVAPTCTAGGYDVYTCNDCGDTVHTNETDALGHDLSETVVPATCTATGTKTTTCSRNDYSNVETLPMIEHTWVETSTTPATCTETGTKYETCSVCNTTKETAIEALGHDWDEDNAVANAEGTEATVTCKRDSSHTYIKNLLEDVWDGSTATIWSKGSGTEADPYKIETCANLAYLAQKVNSGTDYAGVYFEQTFDLNLNNYDWAPIGASVAYSYSSSTDYYFKGNYDGGKYNISNINVSGSRTKGIGLFGQIGGNATIANVNVVSGLVTSSATSIYAGGIVGYVYSSADGVNITNCHSGVSIEPSTKSGTIYSGGIVGSVASALCISQCSNSGNITAAGNAGGIIGRVSSGFDVKILDSYNSGNLSMMSGASSASMGGLIGYTYSATVKNSYNIGSVNASNAGGFIGYVYSYGTTVNVSNSYGAGGVTTTSTGNAGRFVGYCAGTTSLKNCIFVNSDSATLSDTGAGSGAFTTDNCSVVDVANWVTDSSVSVLTKGLDNVTYNDAQVPVYTLGTDRIQLYWETATSEQEPPAELQRAFSLTVTPTGATVSIAYMADNYDASEAPVATATTGDASDTWTATLKPTESYTVTVAKDGYVSQTFTIEAGEDAYSNTISLEVIPSVTVSYATTTGGKIKIGADAEAAAGGNEILAWNESSAGVTAIADEHYHFVKWVAGDDASADAYSAEATITPARESATYTAVFAPDTYSIIYNANNGEGAAATEPAVRNCGANDEALILPTAESLGFENSYLTLVGWATTPEVGEGATIYNAGATLDSELASTDGSTVTFYAVWQDARPTAQITVADAATAKLISVVKTATSSKSGYTDYDLTFTAGDTSLSLDDLVIESSNNQVATASIVDGKLRVKAIGGGDATITLSAAAKDARDGYKAAESVTIPVAVAAVTFAGGSLRDDFAGADFTKAAIRMGYQITLPESVDVSTCKWNWSYGLNPDKLTFTREGANSVYDETTRTFTTNLVFTNIGCTNYTTELFSQLNVTFTYNGEEVAVNSGVQSRSVAYVATCVRDNSQESDTVRAFASGLLNMVKDSEGEWSKNYY